jgi:preprotein translocase subunit SecE
VAFARYSGRWAVRSYDVAAAFEIYKPAQGKRTRWATFGVGCGLAVITGYWLSSNLEGYPMVLQYVLPLAIVIGVSYLMFHIINRPTMADFLIATEGEMKKVSWSSRREIIGSTKVVIIATFALAVMLFVVDFFFSWLFQKMRVILVTGS